MNYSTTTLSNGLRVIHLPSSSPVVYCGYQIGVGSRDEIEGEEGLAHFCEHVTFKGTERRRAWNILNCLESVGGDLNAYTNKEDTTYYAAILKEHVGRAIELLTDIVFHSTYPQSEIDKEVEVICDEIESYNDSPAELIYDDFENIIFHGHPLGHNILGTADNVRRFSTEKALEFTRKYYRPDNAIFFVYGDVDFKKVVRWLSAQHDLSPVPSTEDKESQPAEDMGQGVEAGMEDQTGQEIILSKGTHQAHVMVGARAYDIQSDRRIPLYLLNNILGGPGMNARLNIVLREHRGLVYTVESSMVSYGDTGIWSIYFGCDPKDVKRCLRLVRRELDRFMQKPISETRLRAAKKQIKGQIGVACDNRENFALDFGKSFLHYGWEKDVNHLFQNIDAVTAEDLQKVAQEIFAEEKITTLIYS
ncbi:MAG: insulinase family protein [Prevotella sp.]|nr:insulinase family protein [Prevotella sp.]